MECWSEANGHKQTLRTQQSSSDLAPRLSASFMDELVAFFRQL
jgi:hypothetical protein